LKIQALSHKTFDKWNTEISTKPIEFDGYDNILEYAGYEDNAFYEMSVKITETTVS